VTSPPVLPAAPHSKGWVIGRVAGAPLILQPLWFLVAAVITALLVPLVRSALPGVAAGWTVVIAATFVVVLFASVLLHELAHAFVARRLGRHVHEVVLSALGGHTAFARGSLGPGGSALVAAAGPAVNLVLGGALLAAAQPLLAGATLTQRATGVLVTAMASANLLVAGFNLIPGLPLDGGQLLASLVWRLTGRQHTGTVVAAWVGRLLAVGIVAWALGGPVLSGRTPDAFTLVWTLVIAVAVWSGASGALRQAVAQDRAAQLSVDAVGRRAGVLPEDATAADAAALTGGGGATGAWTDGGQAVGEAVLVGTDGVPVAYVDQAALAAVPHDSLATTPAWAVAAPLRPGAVVDAELVGQDLLMALVHAFRVQPVVVALRGGAPVALVLDAEVARRLQH